MPEIRELAGRVLMVGLAGHELPAVTRRRLVSLGPCGVILFDRNLDSPTQTRDLLRQVREGLDRPGLFGVDQEGGRVSRLARWAGSTPTAVELAATAGDAIERFATTTAAAVRSLGFNLDFAPVVDVGSPLQTNGIGDRAYGAEPSVVTRSAGRFLRALQQAGVAGCLKHFPGLGEARVDSHVELPEDRRSLEQLEARDLLPFRALCGEAASVMAGHGHYPALDPDSRRPASASPRILRGLLRGQLGFDGLVVSDDLEMGAVKELDRDGSYGVDALHAGCDLLLYCHSLDRAEAARDAIATRAAADPEFAAILRAAAGRVESAAARWPVRPDDGGDAIAALGRFTLRA